MTLPRAIEHITITTDMNAWFKENEAVLKQDLATWAGTAAGAINILAAAAHAHGALLVADSTWATPLGWEGFASLREATALPLYAIGGLTPNEIATARQHGAQGIAAIRALWPR